MYVYHVCFYPTKPEIPDLRKPCEIWELSARLLEEKLILLTTNPLLHPKI